MPDEQDWFTDTEGNLTAPGDGTKPPSDEFGRDDPAALERERRRRGREQRRAKPLGKKRKSAPAAEAAPATEPKAAESIKRRMRDAQRRAKSWGKKRKSAPAAEGAPATEPKKSAESIKRRMRGLLARVSDRAIGIALGIALGIAVILIFLFLGSRSTIDEPSISNVPGAQTQTQSAPPAAKPQ